MLTNVTNYQLALFLEKFNVAELVNRLLTKVEFVTQRKSLKEFSQLLFQAGIEHCFYCHRKLTASTHVDHFIPWSYMQSDYLWNFVLACPSCNTRKNNKLATEHYLHTLIERNNTWVKEDIHTIAFETYTPEKLNSLYEYSKVNGFPYDWQPANISP